MTREKSFIFFAVATFLLLFSACSEKASTAGVLSETESGQTASLTVTVNTLVDDDLNSRPMVALTRIVDGRTVIVDSAVTDDSNKVYFKDIPLSGFSIVAMAQDTLNNIDYATIITDKTLESSNLLNDTGFAETHLELDLYKAAKIRLNTASIDAVPGDTICITGTLSCGIFDQAAEESGFISIEKIPAATNSEAYMDYQSLEVIHAGAVHTDSIYWRVFPNDDHIANKEAVVDIVSEWTFTLPSISLLDSLNDKALDSLIVPIPEKTARSTTGLKISAYGSFNTTAFADDTQKQIPWQTNNDETDSITTWITLPPMDSSITVYKVSGEISSASPTSRISNYFTKTDSGTTISSNVFSDDSSFAFSFWIEKDASEDSNLVFVSSVEDSIGYEIRQCEGERTSLCTKIFNGIDTLSTDSIEYGKSKILDGSRHHYSLVIHKKHLTIAIDGETVRNTDLKLSEKFYKLKGIHFGETQLNDAMQYSFGDFIRKSEDKDWSRLKAWLKAFYTMQQL